MTSKLELYPFDNVEMHVVPCFIYPPLFSVKVSGTTESLDATIQLKNTKKIENGFLVVEVLGENGQAIGEEPYTRQIDVQEVLNTNGVMVIGKGKSATLSWREIHQLSTTHAVGFFPLSLQSLAQEPGAPSLHLVLGVSTVSEKVTGLATVTQALADPVVLTSHVLGQIKFDPLLPPTNPAIEIDLVGYSDVYSPIVSSTPPVPVTNLKAKIVFEAGWNNGKVHYQYLTGSGWVSEVQKIEINPQFVKRESL